jgi:hypothetical protein
MLFGNFRAARQISLATLLIQKQLDVQKGLGSFRGDARHLAKTLVMATWKENPTLRNVDEIPRAAVLAAAAMANGVKDLDRLANKPLAEMVRDCLQGYLAHIFPVLVMDVERLRGVDRVLLAQAYMPFDGIPPKPLRLGKLFE